MNGPAGAASRSWFYTAMGGVALLAIAIGFGRTYALPLAQGTFDGPHGLHVHGALAIAILVTMLPAGFHQATRDAAAGAGPTGISAMLGVVTSGVQFALLVAAGIVARRDREAHARWMLLATIVLLWPAWFRFRHYFPAVERPEIWFALVLPYAWIGVAWLHDLVVRSAVHPVLLWAGPALVVIAVLETAAFDSPWWRAASHAIYGWLEGSGWV